MLLPTHAIECILEIFSGDLSMLQLVELVFSNTSYSRPTTLKLVNAAFGRGGESWRCRCLAALLLEHQVLRLSSRNLDEHRFIFRQLGISLGPEQAAAEELLKQGYTQTELEGFVAEVRRRLARLEYLHNAIAHCDATRDDWSDFLALTQQETRITLARYCFTPEEVVAHIRGQVEISRGVKHIRDRDRRWFNRMAERTVDELPALEATVTRELARDQHIYWVCTKTSSRLNSLVEFPLTSAVLTVKPPGSHVELEIKRAGTRGQRKLNVITQHNGKSVPISHQLHGSSYGWLGRREAQAASLFSYIFRLVHRKKPPMCLTLAILSLRTVPNNESEAHILDYLTSPHIFGEGFEEMRAAMRNCVEMLPPHTAVAYHSYPGTVGLTLEFLAQAQPQQALLLNTTSFRLDKLALYLSEDGPREYFDRGLHVNYTEANARRLADDVLSEILGTYTRPTTPWSDYRNYVLSALDINRNEADHNFLECMRQIGEFWGTLLGVRGYSDGESFVARNVGLRTVWENGQWRIRVLFMDHDDLFVLAKEKLHFWPYRPVLGMHRDEIYIMGGKFRDDAETVVSGDVAILRQIYVVSEATASAGLSTLQQAIKLAYEKTLNTVEIIPQLQEIFFPPFTANLRDWDTVVRIYLDSLSNGEDWKPKALDYLENKAYEEKRVRNYILSIEEYSDFLKRMSFLYQSR